MVPLPPKFCPCPQVTPCPVFLPVYPVATPPVVPDWLSPPPKGCVPEPTLEPLPPQLEVYCPGMQPELLLVPLSLECCDDVSWVGVLSTCLAELPTLDEVTDPVPSMRVLGVLGVTFVLLGSCKRRLRFSISLSWLEIFLSRSLMRSCASLRALSDSVFEVLSCPSQSILTVLNCDSSSWILELSVLILISYSEVFAVMLTLTWLCFLSSLSWLLRVVISFLRFWMILVWSPEMLTLLVATSPPFSISINLFLRRSFSAILSLRTLSTLRNQVDSPWISPRWVTVSSSQCMVLRSVEMKP